MRKLPREGTKIPPFFLMLGMMFLFGMFTLPFVMMALEAGAPSHASFGVGLIFVFAVSGFVLTGETENLLPNPEELEMLSSLPVAPGGLVLAKSCNILILAAVAGFTNGLITYFVGLAFYDHPLYFLWLFPLLMVMAAMSGACFIVFLGAAIVLPLPRRWVKSSLGFVNMTIILCVMLGPQLLINFDSEPSVSMLDFVEYVPVAWLAYPLSGIDQGWNSDMTAKFLFALGGLGLALALVPIAVRFGFGSKFESESSSDSGHSTSGVSQQELLRADKAGVNSLERAGYDLTAYLVWRDPKLRMATLTQITFPIMIVFISMSDSGAGAGLMYAPMFAAVSSAFITQSLRSEFADASWIFKALPLSDSRPMWMGVHRYYQNKIMPPLALITGIGVGLVHQNFTTGVLVAVLCFGFGVAGLSLSHFAVAGPPYSRRFRAGASNIKIGALLITMFALMLLIVPLAITMHMFEGSPWIFRSIALGVAILAVLVTEILRRYALRPLPVDPASF